MKKLALAVVGLALVGNALVAPSAIAAPKDQAEITSPTLMRVDKQEPTTVTIAGVSKNDRIQVAWGDGTTDRARTNCSAKRAKAFPKVCAVTLDHRYSWAEDFNLVVKNRGRTILAESVQIAPSPVPTREPANKSVGWSTTSGAARYAPCSTVRWFFDGTAATPNQMGAIEDARWALATLSRETGLTFEQVDSRDNSDLVIAMENLGAPNPAGLGGWTGGRGSVRINTQSAWSDDVWGGADASVSKSWREGNTIYTMTRPGRAWLFVHEIMHAMGFDHVDEQVAGRELMNPIITYGGFGPGDLEGLHTLYLNAPCPAIQ
jgi:hypothetical protein